MEKLSENHADIMKFYLSKADEAGHENDRQVCYMAVATGILLFSVSVMELL